MNPWWPDKEWFDSYGDMGTYALQPIILPINWKVIARQGGCPWCKETITEQPYERITVCPHCGKGVM
jgi:hypothetical protein